MSDPKNLTPPEQADYILEFLSQLSRPGRVSPENLADMRGLLRRKLPFTAVQIERMVQLGENPGYHFPFATVLRLAESIPPTPELIEGLRRMRGAHVLRAGWVSGHQALIARIDALLDPRPPDAPFEACGAWSRHIAAEVTPAWRAVLESGAEISGREPSRKWRTAAADRVAAIGPRLFRHTALRWLEHGPNPGERHSQTAPQDAVYQLGLLWSMADFADAQTAASIARFAEQSLRKIPALGAVSQRSGNACIGVLAAMHVPEAVAELARLAMRARYHTARRLVEEALEDAAGRQGLSREELEEITVPTFGMNHDGRRAEPCGGWIIELNAEGELIFRTSGGKASRSAPEEVKAQFGETLAEMKEAAKAIPPLRRAHRVRLERLLLTERAIPLETWRAAYLDHPLISGFTRRLIWEFASGETAIWHDGAMRNWCGVEVAAEGPVRLWHPIRSQVQTVLSWRCWLEDHDVRQPFKQAHREVYLLTDAERQTATFSNRFAGHILRQTPFAALCAERGWRFRLMGQWDSHNTPFWEVPNTGLRAEYHVDFPRDETTGGHAVYLYLEGRQVRFRKDGEPCPLETVPPAIFSEVMRDVDLFVSVSSIGSDPEWGRRLDAPFRQYWDHISFGELSASGEQRREILQRLVPKLAIAGRCRLEERHLVVRGDRATYKIHIGSSNVLMEPGSRYLCIVPSTSRTHDVHLPFDGDTVLATILSKAFLLAADAHIKDPGILRQIG